MARVLLFDHDPLWSGRFEAEATALRRTLGAVALGIHHVGSTAVQGLVAKPIVDILVVATGLEALDARRAALERSGFRWRGEYGIAGRRYLDRLDPDAPLGKAAHVHAFAAGHPDVARHLRFRDALRTSPEMRDAYAALKRSLAACVRERYQEGKAAFIEAALRDP